MRNNKNYTWVTVITEQWLLIYRNCYNLNVTITWMSNLQSLDCESNALTLPSSRHATTCQLWQIWKNLPYNVVFYTVIIILPLTTRDLSLSLLDTKFQLFYVSLRCDIPDSIFPFRQVENSTENNKHTR